MRIISQDGTIDIPYEQVVIQRFKTEIYFLNKNLTGIEQLVNDMEIASYSTEEKAQKAMEMLREAYCGVFSAKMNSDEVTLDELKTALNEWKPQLVSVSDTSHVECKYFQFPKDEDVEV